ncbi:MAG: energy-coupling factor transporter transmembrane protein EcfT [Anaerolineaceae bacterium]|nr:energy-coupling factor transporter transmembrane protein EcfT [Anaerolineaceae bacterium]
MVVSFGYRPRKSFIEKFDPRARWIFSIVSLFTIVNFWDIRFLSYFLAIAILQYLLSNLTWKETRRAWTFVIFLIFVMVFVNTILTKGGLIADVSRDPHIIFEIQKPFLITMSIERLWFALTQVVRVLSITLLFIVVPFTMNPRQYGTTFKGLGFGDKLAFTMDLAFRFVPTMARDFSVTLDAQKARGYELDKFGGNIFKRIARLAPLIIPVTMNSLLSGEDMVNAMDLRSFSSGNKRTWMETLEFGTRDYLLILYSVVLLIASFLLPRLFDLGNFWIPGFILP